MPHGEDAEHADLIVGWVDVDGNKHDGPWEPRQYENVDLVTLQLPEEMRPPGDDGYRSFGVFFTEDYDFDEWYEDEVETQYG